MSATLIADISPTDLPSALHPAALVTAGHFEEVPPAGEWYAVTSTVLPATMGCASTPDTHTRTLPSPTLTPPRRLPVPIRPPPTTTELAAKDAGSVGAVVALVTSVSGGQLAVVNALGRLARCGADASEEVGEEEEDVPIFVHPLRFGFGSGPFGQYAAAALSNALLIPFVIAAVACCIVPHAVVRFAFDGPKKGERVSVPPIDDNDDILFAPLVAFTETEGTQEVTRSPAALSSSPSSLSPAARRARALGAVRDRLGWPSVLIFPISTLAEGTAASIVSSFRSPHWYQNFLGAVGCAFFVLFLIFVVHSVVWRIRRWGPVGLTSPTAGEESDAAASLRQPSVPHLFRSVCAALLRGLRHCSPHVLATPTHEWSPWPTPALTADASLHVVPPLTDAELATASFHAPPAAYQSAKMAGEDAVRYRRATARALSRYGHFVGE